MSNNSGIILNLITGKPGAGKSTVSKRLRELGYSVLDTDVLFKDIISNDTMVRTALYARLGVPVTDDKGNLSGEITSKYINDKATYDMVWAEVSHRMVEVIGSIRASFVEVPVLYPWLNAWLESQGRMRQPPWSPGSMVHQFTVREFRIEVSNDDERIERLVSDFVKKEDLYLGGGGSTMDLLFHSREEIERNKNAVTAYRTVIKTLDERQSACSVAENNCFTEIELHTYRNDNPDSPVLIAEKIVEEING
jgi:hypothetical protein